MITDKFFVYIDSNKRIEGSDASFKYEISFPPNKTYSHVCVLRLAIPKSYYLINAPNNYFFIEEETKNADGSANLQREKITLPIGNVGRRMFIRNVLTLINTASPNGWTYKITYSGIEDFDDGKLGFSIYVDYSSENQEGTPLTDDVGFARIIFENGLYEQFGFDRFSTNQFDDAYLESKNVVKFQAEDTLYLHSDIIKKDRRSILQDIFVANSLSFSNIVWECNDIHCNSKELNGTMNEAVSFSLTDENDYPVGLNGRNMVFTLLFYNVNFSDKMLEKLENKSNNQPDLI